jgi:hypothetical protein
MPRSTCTIDGCERLVNGHGLCSMHYIRWRKYGDPMGGVKNQAPPEVRFQRFYLELGPDDCWEWFGKLTGEYGRFQIGGKGSKHVLAHRFAYERENGPVPEGQLVLHECDNPRCVNPRHLWAGSHRDNTQDMMSKGRWFNLNER